MKPPGPRCLIQLEKNSEVTSCGLLQRDSQVPRRFFQRGTPGLVEVLFSLSKTQGERLMMFGVIKAEDITKIMPRTAG